MIVQYPVLCDAEVPPLVPGDSVKENAGTENYDVRREESS